MTILKLASSILLDAIINIFKGPQTSKLQSAFGLFVCVITVLAFHTVTAPYAGIFCVTGFLFAITWTAINWHRHMLLPELLPLSLHSVSRYVAMAFPISLLVGSAPNAIVSVLGLLDETSISLVQTATLFIAFRLSPVLPSAVIGVEMSYSSAWRLTGPIWQVCALLALLETGVGLLFSAVDFAVFDTVVPNAGNMLLVVISLIALLLPISLITRLYIALTPSHPR